MAETKNELVLAQNQHAFIQDETKGIVQVFAGPHKTGLTTSDRPVKYDSQQRKFVPVMLESAISQNPTVSEDSYVVLENPTKEQGKFPKEGSNAPVELQIGRKINIPGPTTFALWPGQAAAVIEGHQLKTNEYLVVRVYNVQEAKDKWPAEALGNLEKLEETKPLVVGQELVIRGTDVSFFIPPTGIEVVPDPSGKFVRQAVTLEQLEYCILLDENGEKRYEQGPKVVYPRATEKFIKKTNESATEHGEATDKTKGVKFKAIELNEQMGLYIKVIADYTESKGVERKVGDELFITGKEQKIYFPRQEHALIEYDYGCEKGTFKRQRYYGITIPKGEARYVLNKDQGKIETVKGETIFLPDPRNQVVVQRVLDPKTVALWYPGNQEALEFNASLQELAEGSQNFVRCSAAAGGAVDLSRSINRMTANNKAVQSQSTVVGDTLRRGTKFTPPPSITLNTKFDGTPVINVWTGYAVQVVDKTGNRRVVKGPATILLEYDETLEVLTLSTGKPKNTDNLVKDVYLRVDHNKISDIVRVETKDMVTASVKLSYVANFEGDLSKAFNVENYVKFMCDHIRSLLRGAVKKVTIKELMENLNEIIRDTILGVKVTSKGSTNERPGLLFKENDLRVCDVEILSFQIEDDQVSRMINTAQKQAVADALNLTAKQKELDIVRETLEIESKLSELRTKNALTKIQLDLEEQKAARSAELEKLNEANRVKQTEKEFVLQLEKMDTEKSNEQLARRKAQDEQTLHVETARTNMFKERMGAVDSKLASSIEYLADQHQLGLLQQAVTPIAVAEQQGIDGVLRRLLGSSRTSDRLNEILVGEDKE